MLEHQCFQLLTQSCVSFLEDDFSEIYSIYDKAVVGCCGQQHLLWLSSLSLFEMKVIGFIDPCTFWVHIHDGVCICIIISDSLMGSYF